MPRRRTLALWTLILGLGSAIPLAGDRALASGVQAPAEGRRTVTTSDGAELQVEIAGDGPPCLFVHGGPGQGYRSFKDLGGESLERFLTMIYVDQRGSGRSPNAGDYRIERISADFDEVLQALGVEQACVIAHSFGGMLVVDFARRHPERVSRLILVNASLDLWGPYRLRAEIEFVNRSLGRTVVEAEPEMSRDELYAARAIARREMMSAGLGYRFLTDDLETLGRLNAVDAYDRHQGFGEAVVAGPETAPDYYRDYAPLTADIDAPTLVIAGTRDHAVGPREHERFRFPRQTTVEIDAGHLLYMENTAAFVSAVSDFMGATEVDR